MRPKPRLRVIGIGILVVAIAMRKIEAARHAVQFLVVQFLVVQLRAGLAAFLCVHGLFLLY